MFSTELKLYRVGTKYSYYIIEEVEREFLMSFGNIENKDDTDYTIDKLEIINDTIDSASDRFWENDRSIKSMQVEIGGRCLAYNKNLCKIFDVRGDHTEYYRIEIEIKSNDRIKKIIIPHILLGKFYQKVSVTDGEKLYSIKFSQSGDRIKDNSYEVREFVGD